MGKIRVPKRGMGTTPFTIVEWKAKEGAKLEKQILDIKQRLLEFYANAVDKLEVR